jgi:MFS family permease
MFDLLQSRLAPFRHRDFRNFFLVQTLSQVGTFSHDLARSWLIVEMMGKAGALGNLQMCIAIPSLFFILQGGVLVDHADVRKVMMATKSLLGLACLILASITEFAHLQFWHLLVFGVVEGLIVSFDSPAFQALTVRLVGRADFQQAIALNSTNFHASRMLGPMVAAVLMAWHGPSLVFFFDGITYIFVVGVLSTVSLQHVQMTQVVRQTRWKSLREGLRYMLNHREIRYRLFQLLLTLMVVFPLVISVFRVFIQQKFQLNAEQFGWVFSFPAMGSLAGALSFAVWKPQHPLKALVFGVPMVAFLLMLLPIVPTLPVATGVMTLLGFFLYLTFSSLTVSLQLEVEEAYRGRLSSVISLGFVSLGPLMSSPWGHFADVYGAHLTILIAASAFSMISLYLFIAQRSRGSKLGRVS